MRQFSTEKKQKKKLNESLRRVDTIISKAERKNLKLHHTALCKAAGSVQKQFEVKIQFSADPPETISAWAGAIISARVSRVLN